MADEVISESEARLFTILFGGTTRPNVKPMEALSSMVVMGGGSAEAPVELNDPEALLTLPEWACSTISVIREGPACS